MSKFHISPKTGNPSSCSAEYSCPYSKAGTPLEHYSTETEARYAYEEFASKLYDEEASLEFDFPRDVVKAFTEGDCTWFARDIHELTGWPMVMIYEDVFKHPKETAPWAHFAIETPDGRYLDITGLRTYENFVKEWEFNPAEYITFIEHVEPDDFEVLDITERETEYDSEPYAKKVIDIVKNAFS